MSTRVLEEPKEETKEEPQEKPKEEPKEEPQEEPQEKPKEEPKDEPQEKPKEEPKEEPQEKPKEEPKDEPQEKPKEEPKDEPQEKPKEEPKDEPQEKPKEEPQEEPQEKPKEEPKDEPQEKQDTAEMRYIMVRRQQLEHRRSILLQMQVFLKNKKISGAGLDEEEEGPSELEKIEKELQSLSERERKLNSAKCLLDKQSTTGEITEETSAVEPNYIILDKKTNGVISGVCILPRINEQVKLSSDGEPTSTESHPEAVEVENLSLGPAKVLCPSCQQVVTTEIKYKVGSTSFILCFMSATIGCVLGCCLIPFFLNSMKDSCHVCPSCHSKIQTVSRF